MNLDWNLEPSICKNSNTCSETYYNFPKIDVTSVKHSDYNDTPLTIASYFKRVEIVSLLLNHPNMTKNGINKNNYFDATPLHCVSICPHNVQHEDVQEDATKIAQMLLNDERTDLNVIMYNNTPLMYAIRTQPKVAQLLIDHEKVDVNVGNRCGAAALHVAVQTIAMMQNKDETKQNVICQLIKQFLSRKDFDKNIKNLHGKTGLQMAKEAKLSQVVNLLKLDNDNKE